jgi:hypothetical protein
MRIPLYRSKYKHFWSWNLVKFHPKKTQLCTWFFGVQLNKSTIVHYNCTQKFKKIEIVNIWHQFTCPKANWTPFKSCKINPSWSTLTWVTLSIYLSSKVEDMNAILLLPVGFFLGKKKILSIFFYIYENLNFSMRFKLNITHVQFYMS